MKYDVKEFTLEQKIKLLSGRTYWTTNDIDGKVRSLWFCDGPHGLRKRVDGTTVCATAMPSLANLANSWDRESVYLNAQTIADDCIENDVDVLLAPGVNIKRTPLGGRNFEYFSEDPYLAGELAVEFINAVQESGVGTSLKHYCMNNRDFERLFQSNEADERTMREIYLRPFEIAVKKSKPTTIMCAYNLVNGILASENKWLLTDILRDEWGYEGLVVSDWSAVKNAYKSLLAGVDLEMPNNEPSYEILKNALEKGYITEHDIDLHAQRVLDLIEKCDKNKETRKTSFTKAQRYENAINVAKESIVMLKNDGILPLKQGTIMVTGMMVNNPAIGAFGSALVESDNKPKNLCDMLNAQGTEAEFKEYIIHREERASIHCGGAFDTAFETDAVVICVKGPDEGEGGDRVRIKLHDTQEDFIINMAKANPNVIVCVYAGSAVDMSAWIDKVKGVILVGLAGVGVHEALAPIITGKLSPSGKLAETFPLCIEDTPASTTLGDGFVDHYKEGLFVGYRYYDKYEKKVLFPFGFGLSYANFTYSNLSIEKQSETDYVVSYDITNNSDIDAKEVSQIYVRDVIARVVRPIKELKGFSKDLIKAGETKRISVKLDKSAFAFYSIPLKDWQVENGNFEIMVGASSQDIRLSGKIKIELPDHTQSSFDYVANPDYNLTKFGWRKGFIPDKPFDPESFNNND